MKTTLLITMTMLLAPLALAEAAGSLSVSPAVVMLRGHAGESTTQTLTLTNNSDQPFLFDMQARDVVVRDGRRVFVDAGSTAGSIAATAVFSTREVTVVPGATARVSVTVTIPPNAASRAIVALFHAKKRFDRNGLSVSTSMGTLLTFSLSDEVALDAAPLSVTPPTKTTNLAVAQHCANRGSEPFVARGVLAVLDGSGKLAGKTAVPPHRLLPGEVYDMSAEYAGELAPGHYRLLLTYDLDGGKPVTSTAEVEVR